MNPCSSEVSSFRCVLLSPFRLSPPSFFLQSLMEGQTLMFQAGVDQPQRGLEVSHRGLFQGRASPWKVPCGLPGSSMETVLVPRAASACPQRTWSRCTSVCAGTGRAQLDPTTRLSGAWAVSPARRPSGPSVYPDGKSTFRFFYEPRSVRDARGQRREQTHKILYLMEFIFIRI